MSEIEKLKSEVLTKRAIRLTLEERKRQKILFGDQTHLPLPILYLIVAEERGELAEAILETELDGHHPERGGLDNLLKEAVQSAATSIKMVEAILLKFEKEEDDNDKNKP